MRGYALSITIASVLTIMLGCCGCEAPQPSTRESYSAHAAVTLGQVSIDLPAPLPGPKPSDGKCKNCKGVGKVGDGRTMLTCDVCKGTGKDIVASLPPAAIDIGDDPEAYTIPTLPFKPSEPEPAPKPIEPIIIMHSSETCGPCKAWVATEMPKWKKAGWKVEVLKEEKTKVGWPWYDITDRDGLRFAVYGPLTADNFIAAKRRLEKELAGGR